MCRHVCKERSRASVIDGSLVPPPPPFVCRHAQRLSVGLARLERSRDRRHVDRCHLSQLVLDRPVYACARRTRTPIRPRHSTVEWAASVSADRWVAASPAIWMQRSNAYHSAASALTAFGPRPTDEVRRTGAHHTDVVEAFVVGLAHRAIASARLSASRSSSASALTR